MNDFVTGFITVIVGIICTDMWNAGNKETAILFGLVWVMILLIIFIRYLKGEKRRR